MIGRSIWRTAAALVTVAALTTACEGGPGLVSTNPSGRIQGTVLGSDGTGASNVEIRIQGPETQTVRTGADGSYSFSGVDPGDYTVTAIAPAGFVVNEPNPVTVTVTTGGTPATANFTITADATGTGTPTMSPAARGG
ncbi:MAG: carboxypeptidase regulatory-like domain-containing protein [Longimicrobiales bacterium]